MRCRVVRTNHGHRAAACSALRYVRNAPPQFAFYISYLEANGTGGRTNIIHKSLDHRQTVDNTGPCHHETPSPTSLRTVRSQCGNRADQVCPTVRAAAQPLDFTALDGVARGSDCRRGSQGGGASEPFVAAARNRRRSRNQMAAARPTPTNTML